MDQISLMVSSSRRGSLLILACREVRMLNGLLGLGCPQPTCDEAFAVLIYRDASCTALENVVPTEMVRGQRQSVRTGQWQASHRDHARCSECHLLKSLSLQRHQERHLKDMGYY